MTIAEQVEKEIRAEYQSGKTQKELASKYNLSQQYIQGLLSGTSDWAGLTIKSIEKIFPSATLNLRGDITSTASGPHSTSIIGDNNNVTTCDELKHKIIASVMASDLDAEAKVKVFNIVESVK